MSRRRIADPESEIYQCIQGDIDHQKMYDRLTVHEPNPQKPTYDIYRAIIKAVSIRVGVPVK